jgi:hypothetical protein
MSDNVYMAMKRNLVFFVQSLHAHLVVAFVCGQRGGDTLTTPLVTRNRVERSE